MGDIGTVAGRVAGGEFFGMAGRLDTDPPFLHGEELAGALEMRRTAQDAAGLEPDLLELDIRGCFHKRRPPAHRVPRDAGPIGARFVVMTDTHDHRLWQDIGSDPSGAPWTS